MTDQSMGTMGEELNKSVEELAQIKAIAMFSRNV
jgi:hypothetical protein